MFLCGTVNMEFCSCATAVLAKCGEKIFIKTKEEICNEHPDESAVLYHAPKCL